jgi:D-lactate dehydrogenase
MNAKIKVYVFDSKKHDMDYFNKINQMYMDIEFKYIKEKLTPSTKNLVNGADVVCIFVNDSVNQEVVDYLAEKSVKMIATRSAGTNQIDIDQAKKRDIAIVNVPQYSPNGVAEFAVGMLLEIAKKIYLARDKMKRQDFTLDDSLLGFNVGNKVVGVISTGRIGKLFAQFLRGFGAKVIAYDSYPDKE